MENKLKVEFTELKVYPTKANFILFETTKELFDYLDKQGIYVRKFIIDDKFYIRVTSGFDYENAKFLEEVRKFYA